MATTPSSPTASSPPPLARLRRSAAFARRLRLRQIVRRVQLEALRRVRVHLTPKDGPPHCGEQPAAAPQPILPPRGGMLRRTDGGWRFTFLHDTREFPQTIPWPMLDVGPRDQLWKMSLHYMEYLNEVDDEAFVELVSSWIEANRPYRPGYWRDAWNSYSVSIRVTVWMQQLAHRAERLPAVFRARALASLHEQLSFLGGHLETDIGGNHLVKNIKALLWASRFFDGRAADCWRRTGVRLLERELAEQVLPDGVHFERSPSYHCQVFADLLECRHALGYDPLQGRLDEALHRMARATADLAHPDGRVALFNDAGLTMAYLPGECLRAYEGLFGRSVRPRRHIHLPVAGYFGFRDGGFYFLTDCGPIAPDHLPAHGHGDILSFELSVDGQRIVVDPGVYEYNAGSRRDDSRSTRSHNTVTVGDAEQCDFFGSFRCGRRARAEVLRYEPTNDGFVLEGTHDGFNHLPGRPRHRRRFTVARSRILIDDSIVGNDRHDAIASFLLHPECQLHVDGSTAELRCGTSGLHLRASGPLDTERAVWFPDMGVSLDTSRLKLRYRGSASVELAPM
jgi:uncharacterized heparinase superfamily protein